MYLHSAAATHFRIAHSIAPVHVASVQSSCYHSYFDPEWAGRYGRMDEPERERRFS